MQNAQIKEQSEIQSKQTSNQASRSNSSFDHAEYERWSQTLRSRHGANKK